MEDVGRIGNEASTNWLSMGRSNQGKMGKMA
jgi:hypothetical protein